MTPAAKTGHNADLVCVEAAVEPADSGANSTHPAASGHQRILLSPGVELQFDRFSIYGDAEFPVFQHMTGDQLVAPVLFKAIVSYSF